MIRLHNKMVCVVAALSVLLATLYCACLAEGVPAGGQTHAQRPCCSHTAPGEKPLPRRSGEGSTPLCPHCTGQATFDRAAAATTLDAVGGAPVAIDVTPLPAARIVLWVAIPQGAGRDGAVGRRDHSLFQQHCALRI